MLINRKSISLALVFLASLVTSNSGIAQSVPPNQLQLPPQSFSLDFQWQGDSLPAGWEPHAALLIPVHIKNCPQTFYMQFDLGSPYSLLYRNKLEAIRKKYAGSIPVETNGQLENFSFEANHQPLLARTISVEQFDSTGIDWNLETQPEIIGTIGADLIDGSIAIINYPRQQITIAPSLPAHLNGGTGFTSFVFANRSVLLPALLKDRQTFLYFDTGSSMFELLTDSTNSHQMAVPGAIPIQYPVHSWGKTVQAITLPIRSTTYMAGISQSQINRMSKMGIGGMIGNKLFLNHILILDTQHQRFALTAAD